MNTRQEILEHLEKNAYASAEDLAQVLAKTRATIQYHLKWMERDGEISPVFPPSAIPERGRPRHYFSLSPAERPNNLAGLADALLNFFQQFPVNLEAPGGWAEIAKRIITLPEGTSSTARLNRLARELSAHGYQARWEAHATGPEIVFRNCPYAALLPSHPELCRMDALILGNLLGENMLQKARIHLPGVTACRFYHASFDRQTSESKQEKASYAAPTTKNSMEKGST